MRWVTFLDDANEVRTGLLQGELIHALRPGVALLGLLGDDGERLARAGEMAQANPAELIPTDRARLLSPIPRPPSIRDFYAFEQHVRTARERRGLQMDPDWYGLPVFYFTNPHAVVGPDRPVAIPPGCLELDFELEAAAVVGRGGSDFTPEEADRAIAGYMIMNDWSARDLQRREMRQGLGPAKGKDFATSLGPWLVTPDELGDARQGKSFRLEMVAHVNGVEYSRASLADIHWSFGEMLAYASRGARVEAGDVLGSGTCGTGCILELSLVHGSEAFPWLNPGDVVELSVERLGTLRNRVTGPF